MLTYVARILIRTRHIQLTFSKISINKLDKYNNLDILLANTKTNLIYLKENKKKTKTSDRIIFVPCIISMMVLDT